MSDIVTAKAAARKSALAARATAHAAGQGAGRVAAGYALEAIGALHHVTTVAAYLPIRSELDALPLIYALRGLGYEICLPVVVGPAQPLSFRPGTVDGALETGGFGLRFPAGGEPVVPEVLVVPLVAFDDAGHRLGYGGGYYDRTLAALRASGPVHAFGFAYAAQRVPSLPATDTDMRLDAVITERGVRPPG
jgi:5-formyltetrahydrofolate cyclo-ligase